MNKLTEKPQRILRLELATPFDQMITSSGVDTFYNLNYKGEDNEMNISMMPWQESGMMPVIVSYGLPNPVIELPPSSFVSVSFVTAHVISISIKPMVEPLRGADTLELANSLIKIFDESSLSKIPGAIYTLEEVALRMKMLAKDMDKMTFEIGVWHRDEMHGKTEFSLSIKVIRDRKLTDPEKQLYSLSLYIFDYDSNIQDKLDALRLAARTKLQLSDQGNPCTKESYSCDIPDIRDYLNSLRKEKLIPLQFSNNSPH